jgi:hypothetical protein
MFVYSSVCAAGSSVMVRKSPTDAVALYDRGALVATCELEEQPDNRSSAANGNARNFMEAPVSLSAGHH